MARSKRDDSMPIAIATQGGLLAALAILLVGMIDGARAWVLLVKAGTAFLLTSAFLKLISAGVMQAVRWKATKPSDDKKEDSADTGEVEGTAETIRSASETPETTESLAS